MVIDRESSSPGVAETLEAQRKTRKWQVRATNVARKDRSKRQREVVVENNFFALRAVPAGMIFVSGAEVRSSWGCGREL